MYTALSVSKFCCYNTRPAKTSVSTGIIRGTQLRTILPISIDFSFCSSSKFSSFFDPLFTPSSKCQFQIKTPGHLIYSLLNSCLRDFPEFLAAHCRPAHNWTYFRVDITNSYQFISLAFRIDRTALYI